MKSYVTPVLIVGGGCCGLCASIFLSNHKVPSILIEKHPTQAPMPKARALSRRTMEILRQHGVADAVFAKSIPPVFLQKMRWATSLGGSGETDRRVLFEMRTVHDVQTAMSLSPVTGTLYPQVRLEPLLREHAERPQVGELFFGIELVDLRQDADGVTAIARERASGETVEIRAQYVIAADAGKTINGLVGATVSGTPDLCELVTVYFKADLSEHIDDDGVMTVWLANADGDSASWGSGVLGKLGPTKFGRDSEEWMFHFNLDAKKNRLDEATLVPQIRRLLKLPDLQLEVLGISQWTVKGTLADRYQFGRIFLAGDAAHRHTPTTGLGLNSAVQDAHSLAAKLAQVLAGDASPSLLETYESERRPVAKRNVDWALFTFSNHPLTDAAIGIVPGDPARSHANLRALLSDSLDGRVRRRRFEDVMEMHRTEFQATDMDLGVRYELGSFVPDGSTAPEVDPTGRTYHPTARPGHRLPHAWLGQADAKRSSLDLVDPNSYTLFVSGDEEPWLTAAKSIRTERFGIEVVTLINGGAIADEGAAFRQLCELERGGALLVRPDQIVAWRARSRPLDCSTALQSAWDALCAPQVSLDMQRSEIRPTLTYA